MHQISPYQLYVGTKEEYRNAIVHGMKIVCALNRANGFVTHQSKVGWSGRGCDPLHPHYLYREDPDAIYLNWVDSPNPKYITDPMINPALAFIHRHLQAGEKVFIYCSKGESRSPSLALMYLLEQGTLHWHPDIFQEFREIYYPNYNPGMGNRGYVEGRWGI